MGGSFLFCFRLLVFLFLFSLVSHYLAWRHFAGLGFVFCVCNGMVRMSEERLMQSSEGSEELPMNVVEGPCNGL
jgi:hypothetical protein